MAETRKAGRILVVEDAAVNVLLIRSYLKDSGFEVDAAPNGAVAFEKFQSGGYDLVLMDIQMPVMDGYTATQKIRAWEAEHHRRATPVLAITANGFDDERQASFAAGCDAHLLKPIRKGELLEAIRNHTCETNGASPECHKERIPIRPPEGIEDAIPLFLESTREDLLALSEVLASLDYSKIRFIGHDLKGSGGGYGFDRISVIGKLIEEAARRSDGEEIGRQIAALTDYLDRVYVIRE